MEHTVLPTLELLAVFLGGTATILRFWPELRQITIAIQVAYFLMQMFNGYLKNHPDKKKKFVLLLSEMADHYFKTHPTGQHIASKTNVDERIASYIHHHTREKSDLNKEFHKLFHITLDSKVDNK